MTKSQTSNAIDLLINAKMSRQPLAGLPTTLRPQDLNQAYDFQRQLISRLLSENESKTVGYKIACTNKSAQDLLKVDGPFFGRLMSHVLYMSSAHLNASDFIFRCIEAEFAFEMAADLTPDNAPFGRQQVASAVRSVLPAIEIVESRYNDWLTVDAFSHIADNACHGAWVKGSPCGDWNSIALEQQEVKLFVNDKLTRTGSGAAVLGHPLDALIWLANTLCEQGLWLKAGEFVSTGITTDVYMANSGDKIVADFGKVGSVSLSF